MKKKTAIITFIVLLIMAILFVPIPKGSYDDGGTREYRALTYRIMVWNRLLAEVGENGSGGGTRVYHRTALYFGSDANRSYRELWSMEYETYLSQSEG